MAGDVTGILYRTCLSQSLARFRYELLSALAFTKMAYRTACDAKTYLKLSRLDQGQNQPRPVLFGDRVTGLLGSRESINSLPGNHMSVMRAPCLTRCSYRGKQESDPLNHTEQHQNLLVAIGCFVLFSCDLVDHFS